MPRGRGAVRGARRPEDLLAGADVSPPLHGRRDEVAGVSTFAVEGGTSAGSRAPVVVVHGLALSSRYLRPTLARLGAMRRVFAPDLPGVGRSQDAKEPATMADLADGLAQWMRQVGLHRADVVGHSLGCHVVGELAVRHPGLVRRVVLASPSRDPAHPAVWQSAWRLAVDAPRERLGILPLAVVDYVRAGPITMLKVLASARRTP
ncbi:alpha/beta fold hydrolase [Brachybacterium huguangmaarense]|uniref:alpha/beta fold hydrolase n=1 Tax=Brachybacterium huguangmaarense TaxID=1652028 RepID=UPI0037BEF7DE